MKTKIALLALCFACTTGFALAEQEAVKQETLDAQLHKIILNSYNMTQDEYRKEVIRLVDAGANANTQRSGFSILLWAVLRNDYKLTEFLLSHDANPNDVSDRFPPPLSATRNKTMVELLLSYGAIPLVSTLNVAANPQWDADVFTLLLDNGANPQGRDDFSVLSSLALWCEYYQTEEEIEELTTKTEALLAKSEVDIDARVSNRGYLDGLTAEEIAQGDCKACQILKERIQEARDRRQST